MKSMLNITLFLFFALQTMAQFEYSEQMLLTGQVKEMEFIHIADLDGDNDMDLLSASARDKKIAWYENTDGLGNFGGQKIINILSDDARCVFAADLDGDNDVDILAASSGIHDKIVWYENTDGSGTFGDPIEITTNADDPAALFTADLDGDGDVDLLSASE